MNTGIMFRRTILVGREIDEYRAWKQTKKSTTRKTKKYNVVGTAKLFLQSA